MNPDRTDSRQPPGPAEPHPVGVDPETLTLLEAMQAEYGDIVAMTKPNGRRALFINDADEVRRLLVKRHSKYKKGPGFERVKMLLGNGVIVSDGETWRRARRMIQPAFTRQNIHRLIGLMVECAEARANRWETVARAGETLDITQEMSDFALELILRCIFGDDYETHILRDGGNPFEFLSKDAERNLRIVMQVRESREIIMNVIRDRRARPGEEHVDFLSVYMNATDKAGDPFTDEELLDELVTLIVAGYETSAGTLNWAWYLIAGNPDAEHALLEEARVLMPDPATINAETLTNMVYTQQLLEETLRLYPPVWLFSRRALEDDNLTDFDVPTGTDVYLSPYVLHRTPKYWPDPERFDPSRFGPDCPWKKGDRPYFPFSLGPRRCLGEYFSFLEMKVHLGLLIQKFRMTLAIDEHPALDLGINLRSATSILLRPEIRRIT